MQPRFDLVAGPPDSWKAIVPSLAVAGEPFRLVIVAEDIWGNAASCAEDMTLSLAASQPLRGLPETLVLHKGEGPRVIEGLVADAEGDVDVTVRAGDKELARANPLRVVSAAPLRRYWGDRPKEPMEQMLQMMAEKAESLCDSYIVPKVLRPISTAIASRS